MESDLRYPVGKLQISPQIDGSQRPVLIVAIRDTPANLASAVAGLNNAQLDTPYRPGGWTVRQVVHHVPDSHMNAVVRFKLALTEDQPTIKTYDEARWAELPDAKTTPIEPSLALLKNLHERWDLLLRSMTPEQWGRKMQHPELGLVTLDDYLQVYAWHGRHHVAHITGLRQRNGW
jgi:DinB superfamily